MSICYRVIFETYDDNCSDKSLSRQEIIASELYKPTNCLDFSMGFDNQIKLIQGVQDKVLLEKVKLVNEDKEFCPKCEKQRVLNKYGSHTSWFHDVLTDHEIEIQRLKCRKCEYETPSTVTKLIDDKLSGDLKKIQATLGATHSYRASEEIFELFSSKERQINNHDS